jgi:hypothetical protein
MTVKSETIYATMQSPPLALSTVAKGPGAVSGSGMLEVAVKSSVKSSVKESIGVCGLTDAMKLF